ncbi:hypothetical protein LLH00_12275 [bacterium]|nr:hypothetical protein [bacterium]
MERNDSGALCLKCPKEGEIARLDAQQEFSDERLDRLYDSQARLLRKLDELIPAVARLEVKAGVWGGVGGLLATLATIGLAIAARMG